MSTDFKRLTFVAPPELLARLDAMKKAIFYNCSHSEMIRALLIAGLDAMEKENAEADRAVSSIY